MDVEFPFDMDDWYLKTWMDKFENPFDTVVRVGELLTQDELTWVVEAGFTARVELFAINVERTLEADLGREFAGTTIAVRVTLDDPTEVGRPSKVAYVAITGGEPGQVPTAVDWAQAYVQPRTRILVTMDGLLDQHMIDRAEVFAGSAILTTATGTPDDIHITPADIEYARGLAEKMLNAKRTGEAP
jgi:hypothetical protein